MCAYCKVRVIQNPFSNVEQKVHGKTHAPSSDWHSLAVYSEKFFLSKLILCVLCLYHPSDSDTCGFTWQHLIMHVTSDCGWQMKGLKLEPSPETNQKLLTLKKCFMRVYVHDCRYYNRSIRMGPFSRQIPLLNQSTQVESVKKAL